MNPESKRIQDSMDNLAGDTRDLIAATAEVAEEKVVEARNRLNYAMTAARDTCAALQQKTVESVKAADKAIRANPYPAAGFAFALGALIGFLLHSRGK